jgi:hypothetical protein
MDKDEDLDAHHIGAASESSHRSFAQNVPVQLKAPNIVNFNAYSPQVFPEHAAYDH